MLIASDAMYIVASVSNYMGDEIMRLILGVLFSFISSMASASEPSATIAAPQALIGSAWVGDGQSSAEPYLHTYKFIFSNNSLSIAMTCNFDGTTSMDLSADMAVAYDATGSVATLKSGSHASAPFGNQTCSMAWQSGLEFHLDGSSIYLMYNGQKQYTHLKRVN